MPFFSFGQEGGRGGRGYCQKIMYDVGGGGDIQKFCPLKKYPLPHENGLVKVMFINRTNFLFATKKVHVISSLCRL